MQDKIISLEQEGLKLLKHRDYESAASIFSQILAESPNYEYGACFFHLAVCLEELGQFSQAEANFKKAVELLPDDTVRLGGYASFLYLYGDPRDALQAHLHLLKLYRRQQIV